MERMKGNESFPVSSSQVMFTNIKEPISYTQSFACSLEKNMKVLEHRLNLGNVLKCVGSTYKFHYVAAATAGGSNGRAVTIYRVSANVVRTHLSMLCV